MKKFKIFLFVLFVILIAGLYYISTGYFSSGERAGTISKISERGYIFKTTEGVLNEGGFSGATGTLQPRYWDFSTVVDSVVMDLRKAVDTGERVTLRYREKFVKFPWNGDTKYFVIDVKFLPRSPANVPESSMPGSEEKEASEIKDQVDPIPLNNSSDSTLPV